MTSRASELSHHVLPEPVDHALAGERNERDLACLPRFKAHRGAGGDIEPHAARLLAVEFQRRIGLEEVIVRADLDRRSPVLVTDSTTVLRPALSSISSSLMNISPGIIPPPP